MVKNEILPQILHYVGDEDNDVCAEDILPILCIFNNFPCSIEKGIAVELKFHLQSSPLSLSQEYFPYFFHGVSVCDGGQGS